MAIHNKYLTGTTTSRDLPPGERSFAQVMLQTGKFLADAEVNLSQSLQTSVAVAFRSQQTPSGFVRGVSRTDPYADYLTLPYTDPNFVADGFGLTAQTVHVADCPPITLEYTGTDVDGENLIQLEASPIFGGAPPDVKRTDFVFLEVFKVYVAPSTRATGTVTITNQPSDGDFLTIGGTVITARAGAPGVDEFQIGASEAITAANLANALNNGANSFTAIVTGSDNGANVVTLSAVPVGVAGNAVLLVSSVPGDMVVSGPALTGGADTPHKPSQSEVYRHGNTESLAGKWLLNDMEDPQIKRETAQRVQVQYRIRVTGQTEAVNFKTEPDGFSNASVVAQGSQAAPVATYPFVPADLTTVSANSSAVAYDLEDPGLWVAGDGSSTAATALGTIDGYVYALPICFVFRRNDSYNGGAGAGWSPTTNANGGLPSTHAIFAHPLFGNIPVGESDRPDAAFVDAINSNDLLDLRRQVLPASANYESELLYQMQSLLDGTLKTWAIDAASKQTLASGSGDVSTQFLVCNEVGRQAAHGGTGGTDGNTVRGDTVRSLDHIARRFGDQPVAERATFVFIPAYDQATYPGKYVTQINPGYNWWHEGDVLHLDLDALSASTEGDFLPPGSYTGGASEFIADFFPPGAQITDVLVIAHDDGDSTSGVPVDMATQPTSILGLGTSHVAITLDANGTLVDQGNPLNALEPLIGDGITDIVTPLPRPIHVEIEVTYPRENVTGTGAGTTDTTDEILSPDAAAYPYGPVVENDPTARPSDWEALGVPLFRAGYREVRFEYVASDDGAATPITETVVSQDANTLVLSRRVHGDASFPIVVTDLVAPGVVAVNTAATEFGSSSRVVKLTNPLTNPHTACSVTYFSQDAIPQSGGAGAGYQLSIYFRSVAPQTVGVSDNLPTALLPTDLTLEILASAPSVWTGQVGSAGVERPFPYGAPSDQIAVNQGGGTFPGEWDLAASANVTVGDFNASTGLLTLQTMLPLDQTELVTFSNPAKDAEFRVFFPDVDSNAYHPTILAQPMSGVVSHKVWVPVLARATQDTLVFRKNEVLLLVLSRWAELDADNVIRFTDTGNTSAAAIYRTRGQLLVPAV